MSMCFLTGWICALCSGLLVATLVPQLLYDLGNDWLEFWRNRACQHPGEMVAPEAPAHQLEAFEAVIEVGTLPNEFTEHRLGTSLCCEWCQPSDFNVGGVVVLSAAARSCNFPSERCRSGWGFRNGVLTRRAEFSPSPNICRFFCLLSSSERAGSREVQRAVKVVVVVSGCTWHRQEQMFNEQKL